VKILNEYFCTVFTPERTDEDLPRIGDSPFPTNQPATGFWNNKALKRS